MAVAAEEFRRASPPGRGRQCQVGILFHFVIWHPDEARERNQLEASRDAAEPLPISDPVRPSRGNGADGNGDDRQVEHPSRVGAEPQRIGEIYGKREDDD